MKKLFWTRPSPELERTDGNLDQCRSFSAARASSFRALLVLAALLPASLAPVVQAQPPVQQELPRSERQRDMDERAEKELEERIEREMEKRPRWELLDFSDRDKSAPRITKLKFILEREDALPWAKWARREKEFVYETTDKDKLAMAERFLTHPLRVANEVPSVSGPGNYCVGRVEVTTSKSNFIAGISTSGFLMDTEIPMSRNAFFTWGLAKLMDEALFQQTKEHLPAELMSHLSGQNCIDYEKSIYEEGGGKKPAGKER